MAGTERINLVMQLAANIQGLRRDMRRNAETAKRLEDWEMAAHEEKANAAEYLRRLGWHDSGSPMQVMAMEGVALVGADPADVQAEIDALTAAAVAHRDAPMGSKAELDAACDALLAAVPEPKSFW